MSLASAVAGALRPSQIITWSREDGAAEDLTGATLTGKIRDAAGIVRAIGGTLTVSDGPSGQFAWVYDATDVATEGEYQVQFTATFPTQPSPARTIMTQWTVYGALA